MFFSKTKKIVTELNSHIESVLKCYDKYQDIFSKIVNITSIDETSESMRHVYVAELEKLEKQADDIRHKITLKLLQGGLIVDSRKSTMRLVEGLDRVANTSEDVIQMIVFERILLPDWLSKPIEEINRITHIQLNEFSQILLKIVTNYELPTLLIEIKHVEELESEVDAIENELIKCMFKKDIELALKNQYKELVRMITSISDLIEDLSDEVEIILASRKI